MSLIYNYYRKYWRNKMLNNNNNNTNNNNNNTNKQNKRKTNPAHTSLRRGTIVRRGYTRRGVVNTVVRPFINTSKQNLNNNLNYKTRQNNINQNSYKLSCIIDPSFAIKNSTYYSIFPSDDKVIRQSLYTMNTLEIGSTGMRLMWLPNGVGFAQNFSEMDVADGINSTLPVNRFSNLISAVNTTQMTPLYTSTSTIPGRYRLISSMLKITNTTPLTSRGGSYFVSKFSIEKGSPIYYNDTQPTMTTTSGDAQIYPKIMFQSNLTNVSTKMLISGTQIGEIHYINLDEGNKIFNNYNEYIQAAYTSKNETLPFAAIDVDDDKGVVGNNDSYIINFAKTNVNQTYIIEQFQVFEIIPEPNTSMGNMAQKSFQKLTNYQSRVLKQYNPIKAY